MTRARPRRRVARAAAAVALGAALAVVPVGGAPHQPQAAGTSGHCPGGDGVTVVVDFTALGGDVVIRCARGSGLTGLTALQETGFAPAGTQRDGLSFICRLAGRPAVDEPLPVNGNEGYTESCVNTPPSAAYWAYSHAANGGSWKYSSAGAANRQVVPGGFEGWAFSLNRTSRAAVPAVPPRRPESPARPSPARPTPPPTPPKPAPASKPTPELAPILSPSPMPPPSESSPAQPAPGAGSKLPRAKRPSPVATSPSMATGSPAPVVTGEVPVAATRDEHGSARGTLLGLGGVAVVAAAGAVAALRRRRT